MACFYFEALECVREASDTWSSTPALSSSGGSKANVRDERAAVAVIEATGLPPSEARHLVAQLASARQEMLALPQASTTEATPLARVASCPVCE